MSQEMTATTQDTTQPGITPEIPLDEQIALAMDVSINCRLGIKNESTAEAILASLIRLREIEGKLREPVKYMDQDGDVVSPEYWNSAGDRTKEWFSIPLYSALLLRGKP